MYAELHSALEVIKGIKVSEENQLKKLISEYDDKSGAFVELQETQHFLRQVMQALIDREIAPMQDFVTYGLSKVFTDKGLKFSIVRKETAAGMSYEFRLKDGDIDAELKNSFGGSVEEVCSFMLQVYIIRRQKKRPIIFLDEFFTGVGIRYRDNLIALLKSLCESCGFDILLITHQPDFLEGAHRVISAYSTKDNGLKVLEEVKCEVALK